MFHLLSPPALLGCLLLPSVWLCRLLPARLLGHGGPRGPVARAARYRRFPPQIDVLEDRLTPATFIVTNTGDNGGTDPAVGAGTGTLRQAIVDADADTGGLDTIKFNIPGTGVQTISPLNGGLPFITHPVLIDGTTQPGFAGKPLIEIEGSSAGGPADGLILDAGSDGSIIRDLIINRFQLGTAIVTFQSNNNQILGDYLGTDYTGSVALGNIDGVTLESSGNQVGGDTVADRNVISGNRDVGIRIGANAPAANNVVEGNCIGTDAGGTQPLGNGGHGIFVSSAGARQTLIGGTAPGAGNLVAFSKGTGVSADAGTATSILGNSIFANGLGITRSNSSSPTPNTANGAQNFPVLQSAVTDSNGTTIQGTLNSTPSATYRIEFFSNPAADPSGFGQGQTFLGFTTVTTDANGNASFTTTFSPAVAVGPFISATSTGPAGTSEFAQDVQVTAKPAAGPVQQAVPPTPADLPQPSFFFLPPQQIRNSKSHHGASVRQQLILTNNFTVPLRGRFLLSLDGLTSLQLLSAAIPVPFQATIISGNQLLIDFGPDGLPPGAGINLLLTLGKPGNSLFFPRLTFLG
jgi:hypothetical protein